MPWCKKKSNNVVQERFTQERSGNNGGLSPNPLALGVVGERKLTKSGGGIWSHYPGMGGAVKGGWTVWLGKKLIVRNLSRRPKKHSGQRSLGRGKSELRKRGGCVYLTRRS